MRTCCLTQSNFDLKRAVLALASNLRRRMFRSLQEDSIHKAESPQTPRSPGLSHMYCWFLIQNPLIYASQDFHLICHSSSGERQVRVALPRLSHTARWPQILVSYS